jgi:hypothetical protein
MKKHIALAIALLAGAVLLAAADAEKLQVTVNNANVRSAPNVNAAIVLKAARGDAFVVIAREGDWFRVRIPAETGSPASEGYIHSGLVEPINTAAADRPAAPPRPAPKRKAPPPARRDEKLFSGFFAKAGLMTSPKAPSFGQKWLLAAGKDWGINPYFAAGAEIQPYFRHFASGDFSDNTMGANIFVNAKGGVNLGRFVKKLKFLTPFIGLGFGGAFASYSSTAGDEKISGSDLNFALHLMFGFEVVLKNMSAILEFQTIKVSVPDVAPDKGQHFLMLGVRF